MATLGWSRYLVGESSACKNIANGAVSDEYFSRIDVKTEDDHKFDEAFHLWFDSLPVLDKLDGVEAPKSKYANFRLV